jgi:hypothetical protein
VMVMMMMMMMMMIHGSSKLLNISPSRYILKQKGVILNTCSIVKVLVSKAFTVCSCNLSSLCTFHIVLDFVPVFIAVCFSFSSSSTGITTHCGF